MSYITQREQRGRGFLNDYISYECEPLRKRSHGRLKRLTSATDPRSWNVCPSVRSAFLLDYFNNLDTTLSDNNIAEDSDSPIASLSDRSVPESARLEVYPFSKKATSRVPANKASASKVPANKVPTSIEEQFIPTCSCATQRCTCKSTQRKLRQLETQTSSTSSTPLPSVPPPTPLLDVPSSQLLLNAASSQQLLNVQTSPYLNDGPPSSKYLSEENLYLRRKVAQCEQLLNRYRAELSECNTFPISREINKLDELLLIPGLPHREQIRLFKKQIGLLKRMCKSSQKLQEQNTSLKAQLRASQERESSSSSSVSISEMSSSTIVDSGDITQLGRLLKELRNNALSIHALKKERDSLVEEIKRLNLHINEIDENYCGEILCLRRRSDMLDNIVEERNDLYLKLQCYIDLDESTSELLKRISQVDVIREERDAILVDLTAEKSKYKELVIKINSLSEENTLLSISLDKMSSERDFLLKRIQEDQRIEIENSKLKCYCEEQKNNLSILQDERDMLKDQERRNTNQLQHVSDIASLILNEESNNQKRATANISKEKNDIRKSDISRLMLNEKNNIRNHLKKNMLLEEISAKTFSTDSIWNQDICKDCSCLCTQKQYKAEKKKPKKQVQYKECSSHVKPVLYLANEVVLAVIDKLKADKDRTKKGSSGEPCICFSDVDVAEDSEEDQIEISCSNVNELVNKIKKLHEQNKTLKDKISPDEEIIHDSFVPSDLDNLEDITCNRLKDLYAKLKYLKKRNKELSSKAEEACEAAIKAKDMATNIAGLTVDASSGKHVGTDEKSLGEHVKGEETGVTASPKLEDAVTDENKKLKDTGTVSSMDGKDKGVGQSLESKDADASIEKTMTSSTGKTSGAQDTSGGRDASDDRDTSGTDGRFGDATTGGQATVGSNKAGTAADGTYGNEGLQSAVATSTAAQDAGTGAAGTGVAGTGAAGTGAAGTGAAGTGTAGTGAAGTTKDGQAGSPVSSDETQAGVDVSSKQEKAGVDSYSKGTEADVNSSSKGAEAGVDSSSKGAEAGVNSSSKGAEAGVDSSSKGAEAGVDPSSKGAEAGVNSSSKGAEAGVNSSAKGTEAGVNSSSKGAEAGVNSSSKGTDAGVNISSKGATVDDDCAEQLAKFKAENEKLSKTVADLKTLTTSDLPTSSVQGQVKTLANQLATSDKKIGDLEAELARLKNLMSKGETELKAGIALEEDSNISRMQDLAVATKKGNELANENTALTNQNNKLLNDIDALRKRLAGLEKELKSAKEDCIDPKQLEAIKRQYENKITKMNENLESTKQKYDRQVETMEKDHEDDLSLLESVHGDIMDETMKYHRQELTNASKENEKLFDELGKRRNCICDLERANRELKRKLNKCTGVSKTYIPVSPKKCTCPNTLTDEELQKIGPGGDIATILSKIANKGLEVLSMNELKVLHNNLCKIVAKRKGLKAKQLKSRSRSTVDATARVSHHTLKSKSAQRLPCYCLQKIHRTYRSVLKKQDYAQEKLATLEYQANQDKSVIEKMRQSLSSGKTENASFREHLRGKICQCSHNKPLKDKLISSVDAAIRCKCALRSMNASPKEHKKVLSTSPSCKCAERECVKDPCGKDPPCAETTANVKQVYAVFTTTRPMLEDGHDKRNSFINNIKFQPSFRNSKSNK